MELSCERTIRSRGVCAPALEPRSEGEGSRKRRQDFKPDLGNSAVRHYRGLGKRGHGGIVNSPRNRKGESVNPPPNANASEFYPNRVKEAAGPDAFIAAEKARTKRAELSAIRSGIIAPPEQEQAALERTTVADALDKYSEYIRYHRSLRTFRTYRPILASFKTFCAKTYIDEIERADLLDFATHCLKQSQKGKSIYNKLVVLCQVLKPHGRSKLLNASDWPSFVETVRPIYENAEIEKLFSHCPPAEEMRFKFYLMSGFRDAEGRFVTWRDVDFRHSAVRVTAKPHWGFHPKNWEEREVPVPQKLINLLTKFSPAAAGPDDPLFPSSSGWPDGAMLEKLKAVAWRGKLNCSHCDNTHNRKGATAKLTPVPPARTAVDGFSTNF